MSFTDCLYSRWNGFYSPRDQGPEPTDLSLLWMLKPNVAVLLYWIQRKETKGKDHSTSGLFNRLFLECMKYYHGLFTYQAKLSREKIPLCKLPSKSLFNLSRLQHFSIITKLDLLDEILEGSQLSSTLPTENTVHSESVSWVYTAPLQRSEEPQAHNVVMGEQK